MKLFRFLIKMINGKSNTYTVSFLFFQKSAKKTSSITCRSRLQLRTQSFRISKRNKASVTFLFRKSTKNSKNQHQKMELENTENTRALSIQTLTELMQDIRLRTQARRETAARQKREREEADRKEREETGRVARHSSSDDEDDYFGDFDRKRGMRRDASFSAGSALRETDEQVFRVFQLFDPMNTKMVPDHEVILFLRAVAIDVDEKILQEIIEDRFSEEEQFQMKRDKGVTFQQILRIIRKAATQSSGKQEARRVFDTVLPESEKSKPAGQERVLKYDDFKKALSTAEARITDSELSEIYRYCSVSGNREGLTLKDWEQVAEFVLENAD